MSTEQMLRCPVSGTSLLVLRAPGAELDFSVVALPDLMIPAICDSVELTNARDSVSRACALCRHSRRCTSSAELLASLIAPVVCHCEDGVCSLRGVRDICFAGLVGAHDIGTQALERRRPVAVWLPRGCAHPEAAVVEECPGDTVSLPACGAPHQDNRLAPCQIH